MVAESGTMVARYDTVVAASLLLVPLPACGGGASKAASDAVTAGLAVAAAGVNRAVTGACWADCPTGTRCDEASGTCVPLPCRNACPADGRCRVVDGKETCVRGQERDVGAPEEPDGGAPDGGAPADPCRGLCFAGERCVTRDGVAECERVK
jgi:hypothetical protein